MNKQNSVPLFMLSSLFLAVTGFAHANSENLLQPNDNYTPPDFNNNTHEIVGGRPSNFEERKWMVWLGGCGGSLLNKQWVLTAAHCSPRAGTRVTVGRYDRTTNKGEVIRAEKAIIHPQYNSRNNDHDIALIKLQRPVSSSLNITPINLADTNVYHNAIKPGTKVTVAGWGNTRQNIMLSNKLMEVDVPVVSKQECNRAYRGITDNMVCAGYKQGGKDSCQGDSGGPLFIKWYDKVYQIGIVSWGKGCARPGYPGVYTKAANYYEWVKKYVPLGNSQPPGDDNPPQPPVPPVPPPDKPDDDGPDWPKPPGDDDNPPPPPPPGDDNDGPDWPDDDTPPPPPTPPGDDDPDWPKPPGDDDNPQPPPPPPPGDGDDPVPPDGPCKPPNDPNWPKPPNWPDWPKPNWPDNNKHASKIPNGQQFAFKQLAAKAGDWLYYTINVPANTKMLEVQTGRGNGNANLFISTGTLPNESSSACTSAKASNGEYCRIDYPTAGVWYIGIKAEQGFSNLILKARAK
ncbi:trypsin-like serine protease [Spartinivicinus poritis]|uniref:Trypsin-like serine protease n=1 Tax=Spartinivicinus poritis TaxID=2994640 RepID=A0ABT5U8S8_9GAMM|nr:trypsin-like serine protease [Spartinivicinus sp. A2-2]MDE1461952.1 trypsin-like serine protease [Spartinivicinus sp. A2-2]